MGKFGDKLRREREMRGVTLDEISEATKIGTRSLRALEEERFDQLPGGIFNKGFVRAYARFLGLDEEQAVSDYVGAQSDQTSKGDVLEKMAAQAEAARVNEAAALGDKTKSNGLWIVVALIVLVAIGVAGGWKYYQRYYQQKIEEGAQVPPPQVKTAPPAPTSLTPTDTVAAPATVDAATQNSSGTNTNSAGSMLTTSASTTPISSTPSTSATSVKVPDTKASEGNKKALELQIHVARATWLSVQADGKDAVTETLRDSATRTVTAQDRVVLTTGNAVEITCNGTSLGIFGADNKRSQVRITNDCKVN